MNSSESLNDELFSEYKRTSDVDIRNRIIDNNMNLAQSLAKKFLGRGTDLDDLIQIASLALIKAVERYDPDYDVKFITFATPTVIGEIKKYFRDKAMVIKLPRRVYENRAKISQARSDLLVIKSTTPSANDIADYTGLSLEEVIEALELDTKAYAASIDAQAPAGDEIDFHEVIGREDMGFIDLENNDMIEKMMSCLDSFEKEFIEMRFYKEMTQVQMAKKLNASQMYVSRLEKKILKKMRDCTEP